MARKNMLLIKGKYRYGKPSKNTVVQWDASAERLTSMMKRAGINASKICRLSEGSENVIYPANLSDYKKAYRGIKADHLDFISRILHDALKEKGYDYDFDLFKLYLSGKEPLCETYEEFANILSKNPDLNFKKYRDLFKHAGFILSYDDGFYSIVNDQHETIECGYDDPTYSVYFDGVIKHLTPDEIETFYQSIVNYIQHAFSDLKEGDALG